MDGGRSPAPERLDSLNLDLAGSALEGATEPVVVAGRDGAVRAANAAAGPLVDALGQDENAARHLHLLVSHALNEGALAGGSLTVDHLVLEITATPVRDGDGTWLALLVGRDVTLDHAMRTALSESRGRYQELVAVAADFVWEAGADGAFTFISPEGALDYASDDLVGVQPADLMVPPVPDPSPFAARENVRNVEVWLVRADGNHACVEVAATPIFDADGAWTGCRGLCRDVTDERERAAALARAQTRERLVARILRTFRERADLDKALAATAESLTLGLSADGCLVARQMAEADDSLAPEVRYGVPLSRAGEEAVLAAVPDPDTQREPVALSVDGYSALVAPTVYRGAANGLVCLWRGPYRPAWTANDRLVLRDMAGQVAVANEQLANHRQAVRMARTDPLTGLLNRRAFQSDLERRRQRLAETGGAGALLYIDLDNFKRTNDVLGHQKGDEALLVVRDILVGHTRPTDLVARVGGDEFAVWMEGVDGAAAGNRAHEIRRAGGMLHPYSGASDAPLAMAVGVAQADSTMETDLDALLERADEAMYRDKRTHPHPDIAGDDGS